MSCGTVLLSCPRCGQPSTYELRKQNASQVATGRHCHKSFLIEIRNGQARGTR